MDEKTKTPARRNRCQCCDGRGYVRCDCWPGDCICGYGDEDCEECGGTGDADYDYYEHDNE